MNIAPVMPTPWAYKAFELVKANKKGTPEQERRVNTIIQNNMQTLQRNFPLQAAIDISQDKEKLEKVASLQWWVRRWPQPAILNR
jgi:DNA-binding transcriptional regulator WhiA